MDTGLIFKIMQYTKRLLNGLLFYIGWFACVVAAAKNAVHWAYIATFAILAAHFILQSHRLKDFILLITLSFAGFLLDSFFLHAGWLSYHSPNPWFATLAPFWVVCLHAIFSTSINHSLAWLKRRTYLEAILGAGGIAWTYLAGARLGAIDFLIPIPRALIGIGAVWFFYLPLVYWFSLWLDEKLGD